MTCAVRSPIIPYFKSPRAFSKGVDWASSVASLVPLRSPACSFECSLGMTGTSEATNEALSTHFKRPRVPCCLDLSRCFVDLDLCTERGVFFTVSNSIPRSTACNAPQQNSFEAAVSCIEGTKDETKNLKFDTCACALNYRALYPKK